MPKIIRSNSNMASMNGNRAFILLLVILALYLTFLILGPFFETIILASVLASLFLPLQIRLVRIYKGRNSLAALSVILVITFVILIPSILLTSTLIAQGINSVTAINNWLVEGNLEKVMEGPQVTGYTQWLIERLSIVQINKIDVQDSLIQASKNVGQFLLSRGAGLLGDALNVMFQFFVMVFICFYMVRDGRKMVEQIKYLSPLREDQEDRILDKIRLVIVSVLVGTLLTAVVQGIAGGIGLAIVGIPPLFWGAVMGFASLIPLIGTGLVWIPAVIYLLIVGKAGSAIFLTIWCVVVVGSIDNFARPFFMKGEGTLSPFYIFLAIIGGVKYFGLIGILYGPLILGFAMVVLYIYSVEYQDLLTEDGVQTTISPLDKDY